ncbi:MAG: hypothetical protein WB816_10910 [Methylocystis sp.]
MSSFNSRLRFAALAAAAAMLSVCIQPLYGPMSNNPSLADELQAIEVAPIAERDGHYVRNELIFAFNGTGSEVTPRYRLTVTLREQARSPIVDTVTYRATSATVILDPTYKLVTIPDGKEVTKGIATTIARYDRLSSRIANVRAARDAEQRDARTVADALRTRIAAALADRR